MRGDIRKFYKVHGAGNDFVIMIQEKGLPPLQPSEKDIVNICHRRFGVGADGFMVIHPARDGQFELSYYNADGLPGEMCGNGARCAAWLAHQCGLVSGHCRFTVWGVDYQAEILPGSQVRLAMQPPGPTEMITDPSLIDEHFPAMGRIHIGVPHLVVEVAGNLASLEVARQGHHLRHHPLFQPEGVNVNFIRQTADNSLSVRVYERGVEAETLACGTGAVACAVYAARRWGWLSPVTVHAPGGMLRVEFEQGISDVQLVGPVVLVFEGIVDETFYEREDR